jgi:hypothetical protein
MDTSDSLKTNSNQKIESQIKKDSILPKIDSKKIGDYMSDTTDYVWNTNGADSGNYWVRLVFQKEFIVYQFHGQCLYWFFTHHYHTNTDKVELLWSYKTDCLLDMDFLSKPNGIKKYPKLGDSFCEYKLINDTTIVVNYNFPEWTNKINQLNNNLYKLRHIVNHSLT